MKERHFIFSSHTVQSHPECCVLSEWSVSPVLLHPPVNLTVQKESDSNLWLYWNQSLKHCVESEVRSKINNNKWEVGFNQPVVRLSFVWVFVWGLTCLRFNRLLKSAQKCSVSASTCPATKNGMRCRYGANSHTPAVSLYSGATGASPLFGAPTTAQVKTLSEKVMAAF